MAPGVKPFILLAAALAPPAADAAPRVQSAAEALAQDAGEYARLTGVSLEESMRRLAAQQESVAATDALRDEFRARLAGISVEHRPAYRFLVLLTGDEPVADRVINAAGMAIPVHFRTGAAATQDLLVGAINAHQSAIRAAFPGAGVGVDPRGGTLVLVMSREAADNPRTAAAIDRLEALARVPLRIRIAGPGEADSGVEGGARLVGVDPANGRRYACTTGFAVGDGARSGIVTAAHCPDQASYVEPADAPLPLEFVGQWGAGHQDVQVHVGAAAPAPFFYADTAKTVLRPVSGLRHRTSTRAGDAVCRRGETTGYSCAFVEFVDYAPPGDLCGGPCTPSWVTVAGPSCKAGDSGAPVFSRTTAFGIVKGGNYNPDGSCNFYYYMSVDYLPDGWSLLRNGLPQAPAARLREAP